MKSTIFDKKWAEVKGKFRASYLLSQAIAAMLEMNIDGVYMYTTYENVHFSKPDTMPSSRRLPLGIPQIKPQDEWDEGRGNIFVLSKRLVLLEKIYYNKFCKVPF